jgi:hypothetical protein
MILAATVLVMLHGPNGHAVFVNPAEVTALHAAIPGQKNERFTPGVNCLINTTDGKYVAVVELCDVVRKLFGEAESKP